MSAPARTAGGRYKNRLAVVLGLVVAFMVLEMATALLVGSLALLSDAGHMATDALGLGMSLAAVMAAGQLGQRGQHTFGRYRLEILAALANAFLLFAVAAYVLYEAVRRFQDPPSIATGPMLAVASAGLVVNLLSWFLLRRGAKESLNVEGALLEIIADVVGSVAAITAALLIRYGGWTLADPILGAAVALFIVPRAWRLGRKAVRILIQAAPERIDISSLERQLAAIPGVVDVHDLHVWTLTSEMDVASVHLMTTAGSEVHPVLDQAQDLMRSRFDISHATLQVEPETHQNCYEVSW